MEAVELKVLVCGPVYSGGWASTYLDKSVRKTENMHICLVILKF